jgi:hypothetical protein
MSAIYDLSPSIRGLSQKSVTLSEVKGLPLDEKQMLRFSQHDK